MLRASADLRAMGKKVVFVAAPPSTGFDYSQCLERRQRQPPLLGRFTDCRMPLADYRGSKHEVLALLGRVRTQGLPVYSLDDVLCSGGWCQTEFEGVPLYRDEGHLSNAGGLALARGIGLGPAVLGAAR